MQSYGNSCFQNTKLNLQVKNQATNFFFWHQLFQNSGFDFCMIVSDSDVKVSCVLCIESNSPYESLKSQKKLGRYDGP